jgi:hypothetical protein
LNPLIKNGLPELLFFSGILSWRKNGVENILSVRAGIIAFVILSKKKAYFDLFFTRTGNQNRI